MKNKRTHACFFLFCFFATSLLAQKQQVEYQEFGDRLLIDIVGEEYFDAYFQLSESASYAEYKTANNEIIQADFDKNVSAATLQAYYLYYQLELPNFGYLKSLPLKITADKQCDLSKIKKFIPKFILDHTAPDIINQTVAEKIAISQGYKFGKKEWVFDLDFNEKYQTLAWGIYNMASSAEPNNYLDEKWNAIEIDAVTGKVLHAYKYVAEF